jgi:peptidoglycan/LPS O-acetylase OafA/YrhL
MRQRISALDGLRAVACLLVILYHVGIPGFGAGWIGVDLFFVLSGYLITQLLIAERESTGRIALARFWARRAGRLYPALLLTVLLCLLLPIRGLRWAHLVAAVLYLGDVLRWLGITMGPLGHTWSLAVEEQFYLAWPFAARYLGSRRRLAVGALVLGTASLATFLLLSPPGREITEAAYNAPHARMWELLFGCLLGSALFGRELTTGGRRGVSAGLVATVAVAVAWYHQHPYKDSGLTVLAVLAGALAIPLLRSPGRPARWAALPPLPHIGAISYGLYLFHYPILGSAPVAHLALPWRAVVGIAATFAAAEVSYRWVEVPARRWIRRATEPAREPAGVLEPAGDPEPAVTPSRTPRRSPRHWRRPRSEASPARTPAP